MPEDPAQLVEYYDSLAGSYDQLYGEEQSKKYRLVLSMLGERKWNLLADVGCGTGMLLSRLARKTDHMLGTDVSMGMLRAAREKLRRDQTDLVRAHSSSLPFKNGVCDAVLSISVFTLKDAKSQLSELLRVARPGGTVAITSFDSRGSVKNRILPGKNFVAEPIELSPRERLHVIRVKET